MIKVACLKCGIKGADEDCSPEAANRLWNKCFGCFDVYCIGKNDSCWDSWNASDVLHESLYKDLAYLLCSTCCLFILAAERARDDFYAAVEILTEMHVAFEPEVNKQPVWHKLHNSVSAMKPFWAVSPRLCWILSCTLSRFKDYIAQVPVKCPEVLDPGLFELNCYAASPEKPLNRIKDIKRQMLASIAFTDGNERFAWIRACLYRAMKC